MASRKSAQQQEEAQEPVQQPVQESTPELPSPAASAAQERQPGDEPKESGKRPFQPVRGWTSRFTGPVKYRKLTDANMKIIAFKFDVPANEKLPDEILEVMRNHKQDKNGNVTGRMFQNTRTHGKVWTIPNDLEGRILADKIDYRLSELAHKMEEGPQQIPF